MEERNYTQDLPASFPPPSYSEDSDSLHEADDRAIEESLRWIPRAPSRQISYRQLAHPVAIPQIGIGSRIGPLMPFLRAYSPDLATHDISNEDFVAFIDNLAVAMIAPAPFQILDMGGMVAGFVPNSIAQAVGGGVQLTSGVASATFIMRRMKKYFAHVNREFFNPRGLNVEMKKDGELCQTLGLVGPTMEQIDAATLNHVITDTTSLPERRLRALQPYIASLTLDIPPPAEQKGIFDRIAAKQQEMKIAKEQRKTQKHAEKQIKKAGKRKMKEEKRAYKDERHRRQYDSRDRYQTPQLDDRESSHVQLDNDSYSDTSSMASIDHEIGELDLEAQQVNATVNQSAWGTKDFTKAEKKLAKILEDRAKLLQRLEKKRWKQRSKKRPQSIERQYGYGGQPENGGQLESDRNQTENRGEPAYALRSDRKQQEKETSRLARLRWIVVQNYQPTIPNAH